MGAPLSESRRRTLGPTRVGSVCSETRGIPSGSPAGAESDGRQSPCSGGFVVKFSAIGDSVRRVKEHSWTVAAVGVVVSVVFLFHFAMTGLYLLPLNPVKLTWNPYLMRYVDPFFYQNWHLFAPDPVDSSQSVIGKCRVGDVESDWFDITQGVVDGLEEDPIASALSSVLHLQQNLIRSYLFGSYDTGEVFLLTYCREQPDAEYCRAREERVMEERALALDGLVRLVTDVCMTNGFPSVDSVYVRLTDLRFPRFSSRTLPDEEGQVGYYNIGWQPSSITVRAK